MDHKHVTPEELKVIKGTRLRTLFQSLDPNVIHHFLSPYLELIDVYSLRYAICTNNIGDTERIFKERIHRTLGIPGGLLIDYLKGQKNMLLTGGLVLKIFTGLKEEVKNQDADIFRLVRDDPNIITSYDHHHQLMDLIEPQKKLARDVVKSLEEEEKRRIKTMLGKQESLVAELQERKPYSDIVEDLVREKVTRNILRDRLKNLFFKITNSYVRPEIPCKKEAKDALGNVMDIYDVLYKYPIRTKDKLSNDLYRKKKLLQKKYGKYGVGEKELKIQIIEVETNDFKHVSEYINASFDFAFCAIGFDGSKIFISPQTFDEIIHRRGEVKINPTSNYYPDRYLKYSQRGFEISVILDDHRFLIPRGYKSEHEKRIKIKTDPEESHRRLTEMRKNGFYDYWNACFEAKEIKEKIHEIGEKYGVENPFEKFKYAVEKCYESIMMRSGKRCPGYFAIPRAIEKIELGAKWLNHDPSHTQFAYDLAKSLTINKEIESGIGYSFLVKNNFWNHSMLKFSVYHDMAFRFNLRPTTQ